MLEHLGERRHRVAAEEAAPGGDHRVGDRLRAFEQRAVGAGDAHAESSTVELEGLLVLVDLEAEVGADPRARLAAGAPGDEPRVAVAAVLTSCIVISSTRGGQASMQRSQPLHASTSITTVPRVQDGRHARDLPAARRGERRGARPRSRRGSRRRSAPRAACGTTAATRRPRRRARRAPTMSVAATYAPSMTIDAVMMLPRSTARSVAGTSTTGDRSCVERALEHGGVHEHQAARPQLGAGRLREVVVHEDRRPRLGDRRAAPRWRRRRSPRWPRCCRRASCRRSCRTSGPIGPRRSRRGRAPARRAGCPGRRCR